MEVILLTPGVVFAKIIHITANKGFTSVRFTEGRDMREAAILSE